MDSSKSISSVARRKWDIETYQRKADERKRRERTAETETKETSHNYGDKQEFQPAASGAAGPEGSQRAFLQAREGKIQDLDERIGKKVEVSIDDAVGAAPDSVIKKVGIGWRCTVCNCMLKDSHAYLDHINGRKHLKKLGFSMRVKRSTESELQSKLQELMEQKQKSEEDTKQEEMTDFNKLVRAKDEEERIRVEERRKQRKERRQQKEKLENEEEEPEEEDEPTAEIDPNLAAMMGFSSFGGP